MDKEYALIVKYISWPHWYQSCLLHLNNHLIRKDNPDIIQFYLSSEDRFVNKKELLKYLEKFKKVWKKDYDDKIELLNEYYVELTEKTEEGTLQGIDFPLLLSDTQEDDKDKGTGIEIYPTFSIIEYKKGVELKPSEEVFKNTDNNFRLLGKSRVVIPRYVQRMATGMVKETMVKEKSEEKEDWKKDIINFINIYYSVEPKEHAKGQETIINFKTYLKEIVGNKENKFLFFNIRSLTHAGKTGKTDQTGNIYKDFSFKDDKTGKEYEGKVGVIPKTHILTRQKPQEKVSKHKKMDFNQMADNIRKYGTELGEEAVKFEIEETFKQFFNLIFGDREEVSLDNYTVYKKKTTRPVIVEEEKLARIKDFSPDEDVSKQPEKLVLPLSFTNKMDDITMKAIEEAKKLEKSETKEKTSYVGKVVDEFKKQSRPSVNVVELKAIPSKSSVEKSQPEIKTRKQTKIDIPEKSVSVEEEPKITLEKRKSPKTVSIKEKPKTSPEKRKSPKTVSVEEEPKIKPKKKSVVRRTYEEETPEIYISGEYEEQDEEEPEEGNY